MIVRLIKIGYIDKGNLTSIVGENVYANEIFVHVLAMIATV